MRRIVGKPRPVRFQRTLKLGLRPPHSYGACGASRTARPLPNIFLLSFYFLTNENAPFWWTQESKGPTHPSSSRKWKNFQRPPHRPSKTPLRCLAGIDHHSTHRGAPRLTAGMWHSYVQQGRLGGFIDASRARFDRQPPYPALLSPPPFPRFEQVRDMARMAARGAPAGERASEDP